MKLRDFFLLFLIITLPLYREASEISNLDDVKAPGLPHRKWVNINNMNPFAMRQPRELLHSSKSKFQMLLGIEAMEEVWKTEVEPGIKLVISRSSATVNIDQPLQIIVDVTAPKGYTINRELLRSNLLDYPGYGITPFILVSEEVFVIQPGREKIVYTLDPDIPGKYGLTFLDIVFDKGEEKGALKILSGVFDTTFTMTDKETVATRVPYGIPYGVLPLSVDLPIIVDERVAAKFLDNPAWLTWVLRMDLREFRQSLFPWRAVIAAFILVMGGTFSFLFIWIKGRRKKRKEPHLVTARSRAIKEMEDLHARALPKKGEYDHFYVLLTDVMRKYLEEAYLIKAETLTTEEFLLEAVQHPDLSESRRSILKNFLYSADRVKFAQHQPTQLECSDAEQAAYAVFIS